MKKLMVLLCCMSSILMFTACGKNSEEVPKYFDLVKIASDFEETIYYDMNTKVMYYNLCTGSGLTPIYNADGTLKLYEE